MIRVYKALGAFGRFAGFLMRVLGRFRQNQGLLLAGAIAYYALLSIIPLLILILIVFAFHGPGRPSGPCRLSWSLLCPAMRQP